MPFFLPFLSLSYLCIPSYVVCSPFSFLSSFPPFSICLPIINVNNHRTSIDNSQELTVTIYIFIVPRRQWNVGGDLRQFSDSASRGNSQWMSEFRLIIRTTTGKRMETKEFICFVVWYGCIYANNNQVDEVRVQPKSKTKKEEKKNGKKGLTQKKSNKRRSRMKQMTGEFCFRYSQKTNNCMSDIIVK